MGVITVINNTSEEISVSVTKYGYDADEGGSTSWYTLMANGGTKTWGRGEQQVIQFTRSQTPGALVETIIGVPGKTANIY